MTGPLGQHQPIGVTVGLVPGSPRWWNQPARPCHLGPVGARCGVCCGEGG